MNSTINQIIEKYIQKKIKNQSFDDANKRKNGIITNSFPQIFDPQKQKSTLQKIQQKFKNRDIRHKSVTNWFSHKKSIQSRLFTQKYQKQKFRQQYDRLTISSHKKKLQEYSQVLREKIKQNMDNNKVHESKFNNKQNIQNQMNNNNKKICVKPFKQQSPLENKFKSYIKRSTNSQFYKTAKYRNKFMIRVNNNVVLLNDKQMKKTRSTIQNPFYHTFY